MNTAAANFGSLKLNELTQLEFKRVCDLIYETCGIQLKHGKEDLVKSRLSKRLRTLGIKSYSVYLNLIEDDKSGKELATMVDLITTNKTEFFRDSDHFEFIERVFVPSFNRSENLVKIWCAGCSSGEEPYSLALMLHEKVHQHGKYKILATDISRSVLSKASEGVYAEDEISGISNLLKYKYFNRVEDTIRKKYQVKNEIRASVHFARLNLISNWPMKGPFHLIMCRNVMIYFDKLTRQRLLDRFWNLLIPGGCLFVGFSESLTGMKHCYEYIQPAIYRKSS